MEISGQHHAPAALPPGNEHRYPLNRRQGGLQSHSGSPEGAKKKINGCRRPAGAEVRDGELLKTSRPVAGCRAIDGKEEKKCIVIAGIRKPDRPALKPSHCIPRR